MLLAIDIGNTTVSFGAYKGVRRMRTWSFAHGGELTSIKLLRNIKGSFTDAAIASVVPKFNGAVRRALDSKEIRQLWVTNKNVGITIKYPRKGEIGIDRLVGARIAMHEFGPNVVVIDLGTATTFDIVKNGKFIGGIITSGLSLSARALFEMTAKLPLVDIVTTKKFIGRSTKEAMQIGLFQGYVGMIDHLLGGIIKKVGRGTKIVATGGLSSIITPACEHKVKLHRELILDGLALIWYSQRRH